MPHTASEPSPRRAGSHLPGPTVAVVLLAPQETMDQAWQRHLRKNPQDRSADVRIFHTISSDHACTPPHPPRDRGGRRYNHGT